MKIFIIQIKTAAAFVIKSWSFHWFLSNSCLRLVICLEQREMRGKESKWVSIREMEGFYEFFVLVYYKRNGSEYTYIVL